MGVVDHSKDGPHIETAFESVRRRLEFPIDRVIRNRRWEESGHLEKLVFGISLPFVLGPPYYVMHTPRDPKKDPSR